MCRLSVLYRRPLREIASWPAGDVRLLLHYLAKQPAPDERLEVAVASLCAMFANVHRGESAPARSTLDFLPYHDPWPQPQPNSDRYSETDLEVMKAFGMKQ